jgi:PAS domain S-box-containing protein
VTGHQEHDTTDIELQAAMFRTLVGFEKGYVSCLDDQRRMLFLNRTQSRDLSQVIGQPMENFVAERHRPGAIAAANAALETGEPQRFEFDAVLADGTTRLLETTFLPFDGLDGRRYVLQLTRDLTDERAALERLQQSEDLRKGVIEHLPDYVVLVDREHRYRWVNRVAPGITEEQVLGARVEDFVSPEHVEPARRAIDSVFETGQPTQYEAKAQGTGLQPAWYVTRVIPVSRETGIESVLMLTSDVSDLKRAELALRTSEARFRALAEHSPDFIWIVNRQRVLEYFNRPPPNAPNARVIGKTVDDFTRPEDLELAIKTIESVFETGIPAQYEAQGRDDDSVYRSRVTPFEEEAGGPRVLIVTTDISKERADQAAHDSLREQLHQAQRMESVGLLAGGIAHDFNNLLQVIQSNLHFATQQARGRVPTDELDQAMRATDRAAELTTHLLTIGRRQRVNPRDVDLTKFLDGSIRMLRRTIPESIRLNYEHEATSLCVCVDPPQLEQVLLNLCVNARDAMPNGGTLSISLSTDPGDPQRVMIQVSDDGEGMEPDTLERVFEPFYSTKGTGSGLGLAVAEGIVAAHGGTINVSSRPGQGTTFTIFLPRVASAKGSDRPQARAISGGHELILIAEDEESVRSQLARVLKDAGYEVLLAEDGSSAVELFSERSDQISLLVLDVMMPGLNGWQVYQRVRAMNERVAVLFTTGYAAYALPEDFGAGGERILSKPYRPQVLLETVRELLDALPQI